MQRLLFLAYPFPPSPVIGAVRAWYIAKHLSRLGWQVTVVTPRPTESFGNDAIRKAESQCKDENIVRIFAGAKRLVTKKTTRQSLVERGTYLARRSLYKPLEKLGLNESEAWVTSCRKTLHGIPKGQFDIALTTGSPFLPFIATSEFAKKNIVRPGIKHNVMHN